MEVYIDPVRKEVNHSWEGWNFGLDADKTITQNIQNVGDVVLGYALKLNLHIGTEAEDMGFAIVSSDISDDAFFFFDLGDAVKGAAHMIATNYGKAYREKHAEETRRHMTALRDAFQGYVDILDSAIDDPSKFE